MRSHCHSDSEALPFIAIHCHCHSDRIAIHSVGRSRFGIGPALRRRVGLSLLWVRVYRPAAASASPFSSPSFFSFSVFFFSFFSCFSRVEKKTVQVHVRTHVAIAPGEGELRLRSECAILFFPSAPLPLLSFLFHSLSFFLSFFFSLFLFSRGVWRFSRPVPFWDWFGAASTRAPFPFFG